MSGRGRRAHGGAAMRASGWRWFSGAVRGLGLGLGLGLGACVVDLPDDGPPPSACDDVRCSDNGYCRDGACYCSAGFLGNAYAQHGCQSMNPGSGCTTTCGLNAYCDAGACVCEQGFLAVCGTGDCLALRQLCDGIPDCANGNDEAAQTCAQQKVQQWTLVDDCDDDLDVRWRLWSRDRDWAWPGPEETFVSDGVGLPSHEEIECLQGELVCVGAAAGGLSWGVGLDGRGQCEACCFDCTEEPVDLGAFGCE
ncbi:low-density lipoprotein receptor class A repeat-containing protein [Paraliomyxa miuraensis]|nr:low-density lipoprotein receptor class A repeat-containing protein [Paraliomyxa miuraensis]